MKKSKKKNTKWEQWGGLIQRGKRRTLILRRLNSSLTTSRAPGPGAIKKADWKALGVQYLAGRRVILHTDKARSYSLRIKDVIHDVIVHKKKRVRRGGKTYLMRPKYVKVRTHRLPGGIKRKVKAGTQIIDRVWKFLKKDLGETSNAQPGTKLLAAKLRKAQWHCWHQGEDLWVHAANVVQDHMKRLLHRAGAQQ